MNVQQQSNPTHFHQITLDQQYDQCYIFDDLQFVIILETSGEKVIITQASQTHSNIQLISINVWLLLFLDTYCINTRHQWSAIQ